MFLHGTPSQAVVKKRPAASTDRPPTHFPTYPKGGTTQQLKELTSGGGRNYPYPKRLGYEKYRPAPQNGKVDRCKAVNHSHIVIGAMDFCDYTLTC